MKHYDEELKSREKKIVVEKVNRKGNSVRNSELLVLKDHCHKIRKSSYYNGEAIYSKSLLKAGHNGT